MAAKWAIAAGIPEDALCLETHARTTFENFLYAAPILGDAPFWLVTDRIHLPRACVIARKFHLHALPFPTPPDPTLHERITAHVRETLAFIKMAAQNKRLF